MTNPSSPGFDAESTKGGGTFVRRGCGQKVGLFK